MIGLILSYFIQVASFYVSTALIWFANGGKI